MDDVRERAARVKALQRWLLSQEISVGDSAILALDVVALAIVQMASTRDDAIYAAKAAANDILVDIPRLWDASV